MEEIKKALDVVGPTLEQFPTTSDLYEPVDKTFADNIFITNSLDPLSHFEKDTENVIDMYEKITGTKLSLKLDDEKTEGAQ